MNKKRDFLPKVPLYYSVPLLLICISALFILVALFKIEYPGLLFGPGQIPSNAIYLTTCGLLAQNNTYYVLNASLAVFSSPCFSITGNNIVLDGEFKHLISKSGGSNYIGVNITGNNVSVTRLNITSANTGILSTGDDSFILSNDINGSSSGSVVLTDTLNAKVTQNLIYNSDYGVSLGYSNQSIIEQNTITGFATSSGIYLYTSYSNSILGNVIYGTDSSIILTNSKKNNVTSNVMSGPLLYGIISSGSDSNIFSQNFILNPHQTGMAISASSLAAPTVLDRLIVVDGNTSYYDLDINPVYLASPLSNAFVEVIDSYFASYRFNRTIATFTDSLNGTINFTSVLNVSGTNFSNDLRLGPNYAYVNSLLKPALNKPAIITLRGLSTNFVNASIYRDGIYCPFNICKNITSLNAGTVMFNVTSWSNYTIGNGAIPPTMPFITINEPDEDERYFPSAFPVTFDVDLNLNGTVMFSLDNGTTNVTMNTDDNLSFSYSQSLLNIGDYVFTAYANFSTGQRLSASVDFRVATAPSGGSSGSGGSSSGSGGSGGSSGSGTGVGTSTGGSGSNNGNQSYFPPSSSTTGGSGPINISNNSEPLMGMKNIVYWLIVSVLSVLIIILILLIIKSLQARLTQNAKPISLASNLR